MPTGSVEWGETIIEAIKREVKEETGARCKVIALFKLIHQSVAGSYFDTTNEKIIRIHYLFNIELTGEPEDTENEHKLSTGWFTLFEIEDLKIRAKHMVNHIETYFKAKQENSFMSVKQIFESDSQIMGSSNELIRE